MKLLGIINKFFIFEDFNNTIMHLLNINKIIK